MKAPKIFTAFFVTLLVGFGIFSSYLLWPKGAQAEKPCQNHLFYDVTTGLWYCMPGAGAYCC